MHLNEDHFIFEVVDPKTGENLQPGEVGELIITTVTKEAFPLIRFRTGDLCSMQSEACQCGRSLARMSRVLGRTDQVIIVKGINIIPSRVGDLLEEVLGSKPPYQLVVDREGHLDSLTVQVEVSEDLFFDKMREQRSLIESMGEKVAGGIGVTPKIILVEPGSIKREKETAFKVVDYRKLSQ
jgi:phenylacetate-CoA ligase